LHTPHTTLPLARCLRTPLQPTFTPTSRTFLLPHASLRILWRSATAAHLYLTHTRISPHSPTSTCYHTTLQHLHTRAPLPSAPFQPAASRLAPLQCICLAQRTHTAAATPRTKALPRGTQRATPRCRAFAYAAGYHLARRHMSASNYGTARLYVREPPTAVLSG